MFSIVAFFLLGIERFLYGYIYQYPDKFKELCRGPLKFMLDKASGLYWTVAQHLGVVIKVFQFGVIGYDLLIRGERGEIAGTPVLAAVGVVLVGVGQLLNTATFNAIGG